MKTPALLSILSFGFAFGAPAAGATLSIEPDPYVSSDHVTICRVVARNDSAHTLDGRSIGFEAQAFENGVLVMREKGRFSGAIAPGETAETRIGFNGVFTDVRIEPAAAKDARGGRRKGSGRAKKSSRASARAKRRK
ncbi:MAG TPA: hypothetical protein VFS34_05955 [Thermoanaerobaculia bacterium]|nr:hypothetical protein [Thermoanaerobaculia bacterium]